jgi:hypothetical protein
LKPILPAPSTFFIPGYDSLHSDDSHDTAEEERDDTPVRYYHNDGRDDVTDDSNRDIVNSKDLTTSSTKQPNQFNPSDVPSGHPASDVPSGHTGNVLYAGLRD